MEYHLKDLLGMIVSARDGDIGTVHDLYFDGLQWSVRYLVGDTTGRWPGGRKVLLPRQAAAEPLWERRRLPLHLTMAEVKESPQMELAKPVARLEEERLVSENRWPAYWTMPMSGVFWSPPGIQAQVGESGLGQPVRERDREPLVPEDDTRLSSVAEILKYNLQALDGATHRIVDLLAEPGSWRITYLALETGTLFSPANQLLPSRVVTGIDWRTSSVHSSLKGREIEQSPVYPPGAPLSREAEEAFSKYYRQFY